MKILTASIVNKKLQIECIDLDWYNLDSIFYLDELKLSFKIVNIHIKGTALVYTLYLFTGRFNDDIRLLKDKRIELVTDQDRITRLNNASRQI